MLQRVASLYSLACWSFFISFLLGAQLVTRPASAQVTTDLIIVSGDAAPDSNGTFSSVGNFGGPALNDAGQVAFLGELSGTSGGSSDDVGLFQVAD